MTTANIYNMRPDKKYKDGLIDLVNFIFQKSKKPSLNMIEIGSYAGQSMEIFATTGKINLICCIDPWKTGYDENDLASNTDMVLVEKLFDERVNALSKSIPIIKHKGTLDTFIQSPEYTKFLEIGKQVDFVYVDGCHTYESCKNDILICKNILKPTCAISGHDYIWCEDVKRAVDETLGRPDKTFIESSWCKLI